MSRQYFDIKYNLYVSIFLLLLQEKDLLMACYWTLWYWDKKKNSEKHIPINALYYLITDIILEIWKLINNKNKLTRPLWAKDIFILSKQIFSVEEHKATFIAIHNELNWSINNISIFDIIDRYEKKWWANNTKTIKNRERFYSKKKNEIKNLMPDKNYNLMKFLMVRHIWLQYFSWSNRSLQWRVEVDTILNKLKSKSTTSKENRMDILKKSIEFYIIKKSPYRKYLEKQISRWLIRSLNQKTDDVTSISKKELWSIPNIILKEIGNLNFLKYVLYNWIDEDIFNKLSFVEYDTYIDTIDFKEVEIAQLVSNIQFTKLENDYPSFPFKIFYAMVSDIEEKPY